jgi:hypothetical protein
MTPRARTSHRRIPMILRRAVARVCVTAIAVAIGAVGLAPTPALANPYVADGGVAYQPNGGVAYQLGYALPTVIIIILVVLLIVFLVKRSRRGTQSSGTYPPGYPAHTYPPGYPPQLGQTVSAPPGWYPDPSGAPGQRYWDGHQWTS